jgi:hypothetical protein
MIHNRLYKMLLRATHGLRHPVRNRQMLDTVEARAQRGTHLVEDWATGCAKRPAPLAVGNNGPEHGSTSLGPAAASTAAVWPRIARRADRRGRHEYRGKASPLPEAPAVPPARSDPRREPLVCPHGPMNPSPTPPGGTLKFCRRRGR